MKQFTSSNQFKNSFYSQILTKNVWKNSMVQMYNISDLQKALLLPKPLIKINYNFYLILNKGIIDYQIAHETVQLNKPCVMFISSGTILSIKKISNRLNGYIIILEDSAIEKILSETELLKLLLSQQILNVDHLIKNWFNKFCDLLSLELVNNDNVKIINNLLYILINKYLELSLNNKSISRSEHIGYQFKALVLKDFIYNKNPQFYANKLNISTNYLNRLVKNLYGKSCKEIIIEITILNAQILLLEKNKSISEIAYLLNFSDPSYFTRLFKKVTGKNPSQFQLQLNENSVLNL